MDFYISYVGSISIHFSYEGEVQIFGAGECDKDYQKLTVQDLQRALDGWKKIKDWVDGITDTIEE